MLIVWMAYATLIGVLVYAAAAAAERAVAIWNGSHRFVWIIALLVAAIAPAILATRPPREAPLQSIVASQDPERDGSGATSIIVGGTAALRPSLWSRAERVLPVLDRYASATWLFASVAWLALIGGAALRVRRERRRWRDVELDGAHVMLSPNLGPAVVGALRPRVVIPEWALALEAHPRSLMLRHEAEHIRARDPLLLLAASLLTGLFPWNAALWLLVRRLRLAIEIDCDRRVLRASSHRREYGLLLLAVGERHNAPLPFATSLAERRPFLERRIRAMTQLRPANPRLASAACIALVVIATTAAASAPRPASLVQQPVPAPVAVPVIAAPVQAVAAPAPAPAPAPIAVPVAPRVAPRITSPSIAPAAITTPVTTPPAIVQAIVHHGPIPIEVLRAWIVRYQPAALTGDPNINVVTIVADATDNYVMSVAGRLPEPADSIKTAREIELTKAAAKLAAASDSGMRAAPDSTNNANLERATTKLRRAAETMSAGVPPSIIADVIDRDSIQSVEVRKFKAGAFAVGDLAIIVISLKP